MIQSDEGEEPGRIGSALSLPHTDLSDTPEEEHHHDDIVEHLDVIGKSLSLLFACSVLFNIMSVTPDPQVATVSNLTNAANSILM